MRAANVHDARSARERARCNEKCQGTVSRLQREVGDMTCRGVVAFAIVSTPAARPPQHQPGSIDDATPGGESASLKKEMVPCDLLATTLTRRVMGNISAGGIAAIKCVARISVALGSGGGIPLFAYIIMRTSTTKKRSGRVVFCADIKWNSSLSPHRRQAHFVSESTRNCLAGKRGDGAQEIKYKRAGAAYAPLCYIAQAARASPQCLASYQGAYLLLGGHKVALARALRATLLRKLAASGASLLSRCFLQERSNQPA